MLWYQTETAIYAIALSIVISLMGGLVTVGKAYASPRTECGISWSILLVAACCAVCAIRGFDPVLLAYPIYLLTLYMAVVVAMHLGRVRLVRDLPFQSSRRLAAPSAPASTRSAAALVVVDAWQLNDAV